MFYLITTQRLDIIRNYGIFTRGGGAGINDGGAVIYGGDVSTSDVSNVTNTVTKVTNAVTHFWALMVYHRYWPFLSL